MELICLMIRLDEPQIRPSDNKDNWLTSNKRPKASENLNISETKSVCCFFITCINLKVIKSSAI